MRRSRKKINELQSLKQEEDSVTEDLSVEDTSEEKEFDEEELRKQLLDENCDVESIIDSIGDDELFAITKSLMSEWHESENKDKEFAESVMFMINKVNKRESKKIKLSDGLTEELNKYLKIEKQTEIQTLIFSKDKFKTKQQVKDWLKKHDFHAIKELDETSTSFRARQKNPGEFVPGSFRTITITDGVKAVIGKPKTKEKTVTSEVGGKKNPEKLNESFIDNERDETVLKNLDPYMIEQQGEQTRRFVVQRHFSDMWSDEERKEIKEALAKVLELQKTDSAQAQVLLDKAWSDHKLNYLTTSLKNIQRAIKMAGGCFDKVLNEMSKFLDNVVPGINDLQDTMSNIVNIGSVHVDLRLETNDNDVVSWMLDTPGLVIQTLNGKLLPVRRDKFNQNEQNDCITANKKFKQNIGWLNLVSNDELVHSIRTNSRNFDEFRYIDEGKVIYGLQTPEYHEYYLFFKKNEELSGHWVAYKQQNLSSEWCFIKETTQVPYMFLDDESYYKALSDAENTKILWNPDVLDALDKIGFDYKKNFVYEESSEYIKKSFDKTIVNIQKANEERIVYGIVLEPETIDAHNEIIDAKTIRTAAHLYMEFYQQKGFQHGKSSKYPKFPKGLRLLESYVAPINMTVNGKKIKAGSWVMAMRIDHDNLWEDVKNGLVTGFSIDGLAKVIDDIRKSA